MRRRATRRLPVVAVLRAAPQVPDLHPSKRSQDDDGTSGGPESKRFDAVQHRQPGKPNLSLLECWLMFRLLSQMNRRLCSGN